MKLKKCLVIVFLVLTLLVSSCTVRKPQDDALLIATKQDSTLTMLSLTTMGASTNITTEGNGEIVASNQAKRIYENARYISKDVFEITEDEKWENGLTVLYGSDLDESTIKKFVEKKTPIAKTDYAILDAVMPEDEYTNIYMVMRLVNDGFMDVKIVSVSYAEEVNVNTIENFVASQLEKTAREQKVVDFINEAVEDQESVLYRSGMSGVCLRVYDNNSYIDNYIWRLLSYPVIVYQKDITYEAKYIPDEIEDADSYIIVAYVYVTPGNQIASPTDDIYNDEYGDRIKIRGAKTEFHNLFPDDCDRFIYMSPNNGMPDVSGESLDCTITINDRREVSISFSLTPPQQATISMDAFFDSDGISYVEFMAGSNKKIADRQFFYAAAMYMESGGDVLYTGAATGITYRFTQYGSLFGESEDRFVGSGRDIYYERN